MISVSYVTTGNENIASFRYRILAPAQEFGKYLVIPKVSRLADKDSRIVVFSKHWTYNDWSYANFCKKRGQKIIFDVCDDHTEGKLSDHYKRMLDIADAITCNSAEMARILFEKTNKQAEVIVDPVLSAPMSYDPEMPTSLCWYGQSMNIHGLYDVYAQDCTTPLEIVIPGNVQPPAHFQAPWIHWTPWHKDIIPELAMRNTAALLPYRQGKAAKSANRVLEALQCGMVVLTDPIPSVEVLPKAGIVYLDRPLNALIQEVKGKDWSEDIAKAQKHIEEFYSPEAIAKKWIQVFKDIV